MKKEPVKKDFNYVWDLIEVSVFIIVGYALLDFVFSISASINKIFPSWILSVALTLLAFGLIGYKSAQKKDSQAGKYGAYAGLIVGFVSAIIGILTYYLFPERIAEALQQAAQQGADVSVVQSVMKIMLYVNLVLSPAINAGIGALIAWISLGIFKNKN
jgi:uncharacterized membrane protein